MLLTLLLSTASASESAWVGATGLNLRTTPGGEIAHRVPIGAQVEVLERKGDQAHIRLVGRPDAHPIAGWVPQTFLESAAPTADALLKRADRTVDPAAQKALIERAVALEPEHELARSRLQAVDGSVAPYPRFVARCTAGRAEVWARLEDTGVTIWTAGQSELAGDLGLLRWLDATGRPIAAGTFAGAFVTPITNETDPSPWTSHGGEADQGTKVVLGPCAGEGFLTTFPMHPVQGESVASKVLEAAALAAETRQPTVASTRRPLPNEGLVQVLLKVARRVKNLDDDSVSSVPDHSVALFAGERVVPGPFPLIDAEPRWFRVGDRYVGLAAHTDTMETTGLVWWTDGTSVTSAAVVLLQSGC